MFHINLATRLVGGHHYFVERHEKLLNVFVVDLNTRTFESVVLSWLLVAEEHEICRLTLKFALLHELVLAKHVKRALTLYLSSSCLKLSAKEIALHLVWLATL